LYDRIICIGLIEIIVFLQSIKKGALVAREAMTC